VRVTLAKGEIECDVRTTNATTVGDTSTTTENTEKNGEHG
jgi:hypothetical protein